MRSKYHGLFNLLAIAAVFFVGSHHVRHLVKEGWYNFVVVLNILRYDLGISFFHCHV